MNLTNEELLKDENTKEFFGFSATEFATDLTVVAKQVMNGVLSEAIGTIQAVVDDGPLARNLLKDVQGLYIDRIEQPMKKLETEVRNILAIPPHIPPSSDAELPLFDEKITDEEIDQFTLEVDELEHQILQKKVFLEILKTKRREYEQIQPLCEQVDQVILSNSRSQIQKKKDLLDNAIKNLNIEEKAIAHASFQLGFQGD